MSRLPTVDEIIEAALSNDSVMEPVKTASEKPMSVADEMDKVASELEEWAGVETTKEDNDQEKMAQDWSEFQVQRNYKAALMQTVLQTVGRIMPDDGEKTAAEKQAFIKAFRFGKSPVKHLRELRKQKSLGTSTGAIAAPATPKKQGLFGFGGDSPVKQLREARKQKRRAISTGQLAGYRADPKKGKRVFTDVDATGKTIKRAPARPPKAPTAKSYDPAGLGKTERAQAMGRSKRQKARVAQSPDLPKPAAEPAAATPKKKGPGIGSALSFAIPASAGAGYVYGSQKANQHRGY